MKSRRFYSQFFAALTFAALAYVPTAAGHLDFVDDDVQFNAINLALTDRIKVIIKNKVNEECSISSSLLKEKIEGIFREKGFTISDELSTPYIIQLFGLQTHVKPDGKKACAFSIETYFKTSIAALLPYQHELMSISTPDRSTIKATMTIYRYGGNKGIIFEITGAFDQQIGDILYNITANEIAGIFKARGKVFADMPWLKTNYDNFWAFDPID